MNCQNCGAQLTGVETVCPNCGNPVQNANPTVAAPQPQVAPVAPVAPEAAPAVAPVQPEVVQPAPVVTPVDPMAAAPAAPAAAPVDPMAAPGMQTVAPPVDGGMPVVSGGDQMTPVTDTTATTEAPKKSSSITPRTIILLVIMVLCIIGAVVYFLVFNGGKDVEESVPAKEDTTTSQVSTDTTSKATYGGFTFTVPDGYATEEDAELGLVMYNSSIMYSINVDYSHTYDDYLAAFKAEYPDQADKVEATVSGRKYIAVYTQVDGKYMYVYVSKATDSAAFVGAAANSSYSLFTEADFVDLTTILDSAKQGSTSFAPGDNGDAGKDGIKKFALSQDKFKFAS